MFEKDKLCSSCQARKQVGNTHPKKSMMSTSKAFELLHMDLFGLTQYTSIGGNKYGFVRLGENPSALLECLHLEALGVRVLLWDSLVTLGGCRHLDGLEQRGSLSEGW